MHTPEPLVGGEPAGRILDLIRSFPLVPNAGWVEIHNTAEGDDKEMFDRAYEQVERELMADAANCNHAPAHRTLHPDEFAQLVMSSMVASAKKALGVDHDLDPIWDRQNASQSGTILG